MELTVNKF